MQLIAAQADGQFVVDALTPIADFNERFGADFDDDEYDTIGGLVTPRSAPAGSRRGTHAGPLRFRVARADARALHALHVSVHAITDACALLLLLCSPCCRAGLRRGGSARRIGVMTMQPGEISGSASATTPSWSTTQRAASRSPTTSASSIRANRISCPLHHGGLRYQLVALPLREDLAYYRDVGRGVSIQWLDLTPRRRASSPMRSPSMRCRRTRATATTISPTTARRACAMRSIAHSTAACSASWRHVARQHLSQRSGAAGVAGTLDVARFRHRPRPFADVPLSRWQEAFVPMRLADSLREATTGRRPSLVDPNRSAAAPHRAEPAEYARPWWPWLLSGIAAEAPVRLGQRRAACTGGSGNLRLWTLARLLGLLMLFIWFGTRTAQAGPTRTCCCSTRCACYCCRGDGALARGADRRWFDRLARDRSRSCACRLVHALAAVSRAGQHAWIALLLPMHSRCGHARAAVALTCRSTQPEQDAG
jgi:hypothetical protein